MCEGVSGHLNCLVTSVYGDLTRWRWGGTGLRAANTSRIYLVVPHLYSATEDTLSGRVGFLDAQFFPSLAAKATRGFC